MIPLTATFCLHSSNTGSHQEMWTCKLWRASISQPGFVHIGEAVVLHTEKSRCLDSYVIIFCWLASTFFPFSITVLGWKFINIGRMPKSALFHSLFKPPYSCWRKWEKKVRVANCSKTAWVIRIRPLPQAGFSSSHWGCSQKQVSNRAVRGGAAGAQLPSELVNSTGNFLCTSYKHKKCKQSFVLFPSPRCAFLFTLPLHFLYHLLFKSHLIDTAFISL